jgi:uncharacterized membrane protein
MLIRVLRSWFVVIAVSSISQAGFAQPGLTVLPLLPGGWYADANALSMDGRWVVGYGTSALTSGAEAFRWSATTGMQSLGPYNGTYNSEAHGVSADGSVVIGTILGGTAFRWTLATGKQSIGPGLARGVSADGSVIVGDTSVINPIGFAWTQASGQVVLSMPSFAMDISADGSAAAGAGLQGNRNIAFLWQIGGEPHFIGSLPGTSSGTFARAISPDGEILAGYGDGANIHRAFVWTSQHGFTILPRPSSSYPLCFTDAISADGRIIVGQCHSNGSVPPLATIWSGPGPSGPYTVRFLHEYLAERGIDPPPQSIIVTAKGITGDGTVIAGTINTGTSHPYRAELCYANCDDSSGSPLLTVADFSCFLQRFNEASSRSHQHQLYHYVNCDRSTTPPVLNIADFTCFLGKFAAGCN